MPDASRKAAEIAGRVRRLEYLGWEVQVGTSRAAWLYRILPPDKSTAIQLHATPSDRNWFRSVMDQLDKAGFDRDWQTYLNDQERIRQERLDAVRHQEVKSLNTATERAKREAKALAKAAGEYAPQAADPNWIFSPHSLPETKRVLITPELASEILELLNVDNRPKRKGRIAYWTNIMDNDEWTFTHQGIAFDVRPALQDGQHRLQAAVDTGFTMDVLVTVGMPRTNFGKIDSGAPRTGADTVAILGVPQQTNVASAAKLLIIYDRYGPETRLGMRNRIPNYELAKVVENLGDPFLDAVRKASNIRTRRDTPNMSVGALAVGIYLLRIKYPEDDPRVAAFIDGYEEGTNLPKGDVRLTFRNRMFDISRNMYQRVPIEDQLAMFIKAWNAFVMRRTIQSLGFRSNELMPSILVIPEDK